MGSLTQVRPRVGDSPLCPGPRMSLGGRFEAAQQDTVMGTVPISVIWAGVSYKEEDSGRGEASSGVRRGEVRTVKPRMWPTALTWVSVKEDVPKQAAPMSPRSWRTVCGLKCKKLTRKQGEVKQVSDSFSTNTEKTEPIVVKPRTSAGSASKIKLPKLRGSCSAFKSRLPSTYRPPSYSFYTGKYPINSWRQAARTRFKNYTFKWGVKSRFTHSRQEWRLLGDNSSSHRKG